MYGSARFRVRETNAIVSGLDQIWRNGPENGTKEMSTWHFFFSAAFYKS